MRKTRLGGVKTAAKLLEAAIFEIQEDGVPTTSPVAESESPTGVFLVHGHDDGRKNEVARVLSALTGEEPTILHEQPSAGLTIIEKFERHAGGQAFAVVLATADDVGGEKGAQNMRPRARQNVVFEMGYFVGALGRPKVVVLHDEALELPSDYDGVIYIPLDAPGAWKQTLARELNVGGVKADANHLK